MKNRRISAHQLRYEAADVAYNRPHLPQRSNGEENRYRITAAGSNHPSYIAAFTKGFEHNEDGFMVNPQNEDYQCFIRACDVGDLVSIQALNLKKIPEPVTPGKGWLSDIARTVVGADGIEGADVRGWESMGAGLVYDLEGPDAQSLAIPPAPTLDSDELIAEMAELYWMALCRDVPFGEFGTNAQVAQAITDLNGLEWFRNRDVYGLHPYQVARKRGYFAKPNLMQPFAPQNIFRGNVKGDDVGPYISQFLYVGNRSLGNSATSFGPNQGLITYGATTIDQRVRIANPNIDFMTNWDQWLDVQNGADLRRLEGYQNTGGRADNPNREIGYRFILTPRDLCTYVHYDALHQAYFNACLLLLNIGAPLDPGLPFRLPDSVDKQTGFAQFGGPHILNLVSEVATRALKAVRFQKYNVHRRARPEVVAGWIHRYATGDGVNLDVIKKAVDRFRGDGGAMLPMAFWADLEAHNATQNGFDTTLPAYAGNESYLLPMPYAEGSPMHPSYGSGHATVAGACVTILKAFFDEGFVLPFAYVPNAAGDNLVIDPSGDTLTVENELNKLAANVAFGRDWAGVHYWSDQIESLRLGEQIALGILEEQKLMHGENFSMNVPLFDGTSVRI